MMQLPLVFTVSECGWVDRTGLSLSRPCHSAGGKDGEGVCGSYIRDIIMGNNGVRAEWEKVTSRDRV